MDSDYEEKLVNIENNVQDETSLAWKKLCEYVEKIAEEGSEEFAPRKYLGYELYHQIYTLPKTIAKLKKVKHILLYGSKIKRIPPEIGEMEALEDFDPYTSYDLHWFPYEIRNCKNLKDSTVSTRALYGNYYHRRPFPDLTTNPVHYDQKEIKCSICKKEIIQEETNQLWTSLWVGTDVVPLLVNSCSEECEKKIPKSPKAYVRFPHKGGSDLIQPTLEDWEKIIHKRQNALNEAKKKNKDR
ncbi:hypothetical protein Fleli_1033 [Bernardetia litoralis DSM 6794]|uniref:Leucine-rich repeat domain-containing protein n=1 Tax=Bernardetia litoralis (strain ATCC 23117 / DSM 6794 / NBRC 15988 / NCIMB 1366 / Fx l1 / Sio-4) TaxID=880071 RepID=I4AHP3_BERLS|nr:hypothetical protein [Bernardetia litoralis]AFM03478.1 hypothetical protein Fleli_1033 [Bernardetia litoralis DSM 6794]